MRIPKIPDEIVVNPNGMTVKVNKWLDPGELKRHPDMRGYWDSKTGEIHIRPDIPATEQWITLAHEAFHMIETGMIAAGYTKRRAGERFVDSISFNFMAILMMNGMLKGFPRAETMIEEIKEIEVVNPDD